MRIVVEFGDIVLLQFTPWERKPEMANSLAVKRSLRSWVTCGPSVGLRSLHVAGGAESESQRLLRNSPSAPVLCGSVSSWIRDSIVQNRAYVGRRSLDMVVGELPPAECLKFWGKKSARIDSREVLDVLSVTGGVPRYLEEIKHNLEIMG